VGGGPDGEIRNPKAENRTAEAQQPKTRTEGRERAQRAQKRGGVRGDYD